MRTSKPERVEDLGEYWCAYEDGHHLEYGTRSNPGDLGLYWDFMAN